MTAFSASPGSGSGIRYTPAPRSSTPGSVQACRSALDVGDRGAWGAGLVTWSTDGTSFPVNVPGGSNSGMAARTAAGRYGRPPHGPDWPTCAPSGCAGQQEETG